ncbi:MAG: hypothetical protein A3H69_04820 [Candidatus Sungbacteria bacterium RIFCSPLOWO2_02_FULL_47_9]|uniref:ATP synthase subunit delta n=1 Tax=Candidatus Sungbacteria bacterium RIFCSPHIGHO2_01_FULL_47_32 TaxID=1802264 RepID=A0A1G2K4K9_9BACT|nr:MAG: hypothetical protein UX72_C0027G0006 [Parcubacteria group bacterium GW2011_GWA2_47_10]OGZ94093.1 MAG: hypothetical protein A2633_03975 [Candidatus Sungbacteria bacterium RIFCSPHIGHO2_01_FULL_47_32]OGZ98528.1 MAG: hypothetical protein A3D57_00170 [Candidatus Sungbacteria bacterium RIFCSPHIGHO2_02_FULL_46_12]OHA05269.1 MAG: hypothetical protein A3A28_01630 [Candidatus Sungbacteria bacterium RIFCSPLOWO2_01_FULL_47_32]OHA10861.1 MAG: hypothetical protein A3H69_04820 [Candidatus Sungbacteria
MAITQKTISSILRTVRTKDERDQAENAVSVLEGTPYQAGQDSLEDVLRRVVPLEIAGVIHKSMADAERAGGEEGRKEFLKTLKDALAALRVVRLELAIEPTEELIEHIADWILRDLGEGFILDIGFDPSVLGGAKIIFDGRYVEKTFDAELRSLFVSQREDLVKELMR